MRSCRDRQRNGRVPQVMDSRPWPREPRPPQCGLPYVTVEVRGADSPAVRVGEDPAIHRGTSRYVIRDVSTHELWDSDASGTPVLRCSPDKLTSDLGHCLYHHDSVTEKV